MSKTEAVETGVVVCRFAMLAKLLVVQKASHATPPSCALVFEALCSVVREVRGAHREEGAQRVGVGVAV